MAEKYYHNDFLMEFFLRGREDEDKRRQTYIFLFKIALFEDTLKKLAHTLWCMVIPLSPHSVYTK
jgi:hypothetical protein